MFLCLHWEITTHLDMTEEQTDDSRNKLLKIEMAIYKNTNVTNTS